MPPCHVFELRHCCVRRMIRDDSHSSELLKKCRRVVVAVGFMRAFVIIFNYGYVVFMVLYVNVNSSCKGSYIKP